jgi:hypothetical protein
MKDLGFASFDITGIPTNAIITSATLSLYQYNIINTPYSAFATGSIAVDHVDYGSTIDIGDFDLLLSTVVWELYHRLLLHWNRRL